MAQQKSNYDNTDENSVQETLLTGKSNVTSSTDRSLFHRTFGPLLPGAMRGSIFTFIAASMGTGIFNLPYRVEEMGLGSYLIFLTAATIFSYIGMYLMARLILQFNVNSYSAMSELAYGKWFRRVAQFCLIGFPWGATICFQVLYAKFLLQLLADNFDLPIYQEGDLGRQSETYSTTGDLVRIGINVGFILINLIFILKKDITLLQKISFVGVIAVIYNIVVITVTFFVGFEVHFFNQQIQAHIIYDYNGVTTIPWSEVQWFNFQDMDDVLSQIQAFASLIFCYVSHQLVFPLTNNLKNPNQRRITKVFTRVHITEIVGNVLVGAFGYLLLLKYIQQRPINAMVLASIETIPISVGKLLMVFALFFAVPLSIFPTREVIYSTFGFERSNKNHVTISLVMSFSGCGIAILFQNINSYFGLMGGTAGVMMAGTIPMICYFKLVGLDTWKQKLMAVFMGVVSICGMIGAVLSVVYI